MVYLIHLKSKFKHAQHYVGWTRDESTLDQRIRYHRTGRGSRFLEVVNQAGIEWDVVRTWPDGDRDREKKVKAGHAGKYCPVCRKENRNGT